MDKNEMKKVIYKSHPIAKLQFIRMGNAYYTTSDFKFEGETLTANFIVPVNDMGSTDFETVMDAKLLLRWLE